MCKKQNFLFNCLSAKIFHVDKNSSAEVSVSPPPMVPQREKEDQRSIRISSEDFHVRESRTAVSHSSQQHKL